MTDLQNITWQSQDDVLETKNENGHLTANIGFVDHHPTLEDMGDFDRVLFFKTGKRTDGISNINRTHVVLTAENNYTQAEPLGRIAGEYDVIGLNENLVRYTFGENGITISKSPNLTTPGEYSTILGFVGDDWAEIFMVSIVVIVPLRVRHNNVDYTPGQTVTINLAAPNYSPQYLYIYGSVAWMLEGVEPATVNVSPTSGSGYDYEWNADVITLQKPSALAVAEKITTTFRIVAGTQWVEVTVNLLPPVTLKFTSPRSGEAGAPAGNEPVYVNV